MDWTPIGIVEAISALVVFILITGFIVATLTRENSSNEREKLNMKEYQAIHIVDLLLEDLGNRSGFDYILDEVRNDHEVFDEIKKAWKDIVLSGSQF